MVTGRMGHLSVFCSYAREDAAIRDALGRHLEPLRTEKIIDDWNDSEIKPGARWDDRIRAALDKSRLVIFIVTPDLLASDYVNRVELARSLELERAGKCQVVPVVARATEWGNSPLADFQALPRDARPIDAFADEREAWDQVTSGIREACKRIVDWENPYKRAQVGDWTHVEQTMQVPGQSMTGYGTCEVIAKTATEAVARLQFVLGPQRQEQIIRVDLTEPLEDRMGEMLKQMGQEMPANAEFWVGPSQYEEDVLFIGGKRYECVKAVRQMRIEQ
ncbi:MAG: toll/interleukin-1 receptor domain-containing protein, partial [Chromatiales bacterium]|nr:toll/interleukin-1 receptor domain-containing protein [Chromatiales bacterium]